jgi:hypothetical protein
MAEIYRFGVLADTHLGDLATVNALARQLLDGPFAEADAILHAGDLVIAAMENCFDGIPVYAVQGNMDDSKCGFPLKRILTVAGRRIGLIHGWGPPSAVPANVMSEFDSDNLDLLVFGHSHTPYLGYAGQTLLFNPGSATDHRGYAENCSVGMVEIGPKISARHIPFALKSGK